MCGEGPWLALGDEEALEERVCDYDAECDDCAPPPSMWAECNDGLCELME